MGDLRRIDQIQSETTITVALHRVSPQIIQDGIPANADEMCLELETEGTSPLARMGRLLGCGRGVDSRRREPTGR